MRTRSPSSIFALYFCLVAFSFAGCAWIQSHPKTTAAIETDLVKISAAIAQTSLNSGTLDYAQTIPIGLNSITDVIAGMSADKAAPVIASTVNQFSAYAIPADQVGKIVAAYVDANPETPAARKAFVIGMASDLSKGISSK